MIITFLNINVLTSKTYYYLGRPSCWLFCFVDSSCFWPTKIGTSEVISMCRLIYTFYNWDNKATETCEICRDNSNDWLQSCHSASTDPPAVNFINVKCALFRTIVVLAAFFLVTCTLCVHGKSCRNNFCMKNARVRSWWNWNQGSIASKYYAQCFRTKEFCSAFL